MSEKLENKYQVFEWVKKVIESCESLIQLKCSRKLINNFDKVYCDAYLARTLIIEEQSKYEKLIHQRFQN